MEASSVRIEKVVDAANRHAELLREPALLISLHRDIGKLPSGWADESGKKEAALRWGIFIMIYAATEGFFNEVLKAPNEWKKMAAWSSDETRIKQDSYDHRNFVRTVKQDA